MQSPQKCPSIPYTLRISILQYAARQGNMQHKRQLTENAVSLLVQPQFLKYGAMFSDLIPQAALPLLMSNESLAGRHNASTPQSTVPFSTAGTSDRSNVGCSHKS